MLHYHCVEYKKTLVSVGDCIYICQWKECYFNKTEENLLLIIKFSWLTMNTHNPFKKEEATVHIMMTDIYFL